MSTLAFSACEGFQTAPEGPADPVPPPNVGEAESQPPASKAPDRSSAWDPEEAALIKAEAALKTLGGTLKGKLLAAMKDKGPVGALTMCSGNAQALTQKVALDTGVTLGRSSLRLRNPDNAAPAWVQTWLTEQGERQAAGVGKVRGAVRLSDGKRAARVILPLRIEAPCLICHGPESGFSLELATALAERYPRDQARNYALGDLRGAMWAEVMVE